MDILAVRDEQSVRIIDVQSGQLLNTLRAEGWSPGASTHWSPDGTMLAFSSGIDVEIWETVWDAQKATLKSVYQSYIDDDPSVPRLGTGNLAWHPNSQWMAGATHFTSIDIWDVSTGNRLTRIQGNPSFVLSLDWNSNGQLASGNLVGHVLVYDPVTNEPIKGLLLNSTGQALRPAVSIVAWSPDGKKIAVGADDNTIRFWDTTTDQDITDSYDYDITTLRARIDDWLFKGSMLDIVWSPDGRYVYGYGSDQSGYIHIFDTITNTLVDSIEVDGATRIFSVSLSPYGGRLGFGANPDVVPSPQRSVLNKSIDGGKVQIIVPIPSLDNVKDISAQCLTKSTEALPANNVLAIESVSALTKANLPNFITQVKALPKGAIPPACAADLIAVAEAILAQPS